MSDLATRPQKRRKTSAAGKADDSPDREKESLLSTSTPASSKASTKRASTARSSTWDIPEQSPAPNGQRSVRRSNVSGTPTTASEKKLAVRRKSIIRGATPNKPAHNAEKSSNQRASGRQSASKVSKNGAEDQSEDTASQLQKKPHWRGWVKVDDDEVIPSHHDEMERIRREAIEAAKGEGSAGRSRRERKSAGSEITGVANDRQHKRGDSRSGVTKSKQGKSRRNEGKTIEPADHGVQERNGRKSIERPRKAQSSTPISLSSKKKEQRATRDGRTKAARAQRGKDVEDFKKIREEWAAKDEANLAERGKGYRSLEGKDAKPFPRISISESRERGSETEDGSESFYESPEEEAHHESSGFLIPDSQEVKEGRNRIDSISSQRMKVSPVPMGYRQSSSPMPRMSIHPSISPTPDRDDTGYDSTQQLHMLLNRDPSVLESIKNQILQRLTSWNRMEGSVEYEKVHQLLSQTVLAGEGNSMVIIGSRGTGKTALVETAISSLEEEHKDDFHVVRLNGFIHTDDKIALKEIWRQLGRSMNVDDELMSGRSNYADILTSLLALLSHEEEAPQDPAPPPQNDDSQEEQYQEKVAKSVIFILSEFHLFATHPRQTLLYNLFDLAQSSRTPLAVLGLTTRIDVIDMLEKRVKSRFGQRIVQLNPPRTFTQYKQICQSSLRFQTPPYTISSRLSLADPTYSTATALWNAYIANILFADPILLTFLERVYATSRIASTFFASSILPIASLSPQNPLPTSVDFVTADLAAPDNELSTILPSLSSLALSLLIAAARLEIILAPSGGGGSGGGITGTTFEVVYEEYVTLASRTRVSASAAGQLGVGGAGARVWGQKVAKKEWERLGEVGAVVPVSGAGGRMGAGGGTKWVVDIGGLEEIRTWIESEAGRGVDKGLIRWCRI